MLRFYRWDKPAISFGYFVSFAEASATAAGRAMVRRWTGGGIVPHGQDLTYSIVVPATEPFFSVPSRLIYENVHRVLCSALRATDDKRAGSAIAALYQTRHGTESTLIDRRYNDCFANPVDADVMVDGQKIAGAAQRKTRGGLLHQGSIQQENLGPDFIMTFGKLLSKHLDTPSLTLCDLHDAKELAEFKYSTEQWLRRC